LTPPDPDWQQANHHFVMRCQAYLWNELNRPALDYLLKQRGLHEETIKAAQLGYDPWRQVITIPWYLKQELWRVGARGLAPQGRKGPVFAGFKPGLYQADRLTSDKVVVLCEGEFDALVVNQVAGDVVAAVATGGIASARQIHWLARLTQVPAVLVAFDTEPSGERAARWWLKKLPNAQRWRPIGAKDPNDMVIKAGMGLRDWLGPALGILPEPEPASVTEAEQLPAWRRWLKGK
jgi:DNA primase